MTAEQFNVLRNAVLNALHYGACEQALGMLQGACAVTSANAAATPASVIDDIDQLLKWINAAYECSANRKSEELAR